MEKTQITKIALIPSILVVITIIITAIQIFINSGFWSLPGYILRGYLGFFFAFLVIEGLVIPIKGVKQKQVFRLTMAFLATLFLLGSLLTLKDSIAELLDWIPLLGFKSFHGVLAGIIGAACWLYRSGD